jgi:hypothetical protein
MAGTGERGHEMQHAWRNYRKFSASAAEGWLANRISCGEFNMAVRQRAE